MSGLDEALPGIRRAKKRRIIEPSDANEWAGCASRDARKTAIASLATELGNCVAARRRECRCIIACRPRAAWQAGLKSRIIARFRAVSQHPGEPMPSYQHVKVPAGGQKISVNKDFSLNVSAQPIIPYIEGDGTGLDITPVMIKVVDAAVAKAYGGKRKIHWMEIYAGEKSTKVYGPDVWLPEETMAILKDYVVSIKGPLTTPVGGGIRSLHVALRQELDLYVCLRPVQYFAGVPSPVKQPERVNMGIFRENSEDIYAGIEWAAQSDGVKKVLKFLIDDMGVKKIRFPQTSAIGIKPVSREGSQRLMRKV